MDDWRSLREYVDRGSEAAFAALVQRHIDMVYASAVRQLHDPHLAKDVTQAVFILLARKAASLRQSVVLSGWLYRTTIHVASRAMRDRIRQQRREEEAGQMNFNETAEELWGKLEPHLDGAISTLNAGDRDAVVLRFLQQRSFRDVAGTLGISEDAAKKRVTRALEKLRQHLTARGIAMSAAALLTTLTANTTAAAPAEVVLAATHVGSQAAPVAAALAGEVARQWFFTKVKWTAAIAGATAAIVLLVSQAFPSNSPRPATAATSNDSASSDRIAENAGASPGNSSLAAAQANPRSMRVQVLSAKDNSPLAEAVANLVFYGSTFIDGKAVADANGVMDIARPDRKFAGMAYWISAPGHVPKCIVWKGEEEMSLPSSYVVMLDPGIRISGRIVNEEGQPVGGARLRFDGHGTKWNTRDYVDYRYPFSIPKSDPNGDWTADYLTDDPSIWGYVKHPDYAETQFSLFRDKTGVTNGTIIIKRGAKVSGVVTGPDGAGIADASVTADWQYSTRDSIRSRSDAGGRFDWPHITPGKFRVQAAAMGFEPFEKWFDAPVEGTNVSITLTPKRVAGNRAVRGRVLDNDGKPIVGVTVSWRDPKSSSPKNDWYVQTDDQGRFAWDEAPDGAVQLSFHEPWHIGMTDIPFTNGPAEQIVTMKSLGELPLIHCTVTERFTGVPIAAFKVMRGVRMTLPGGAEVDDIHFVGEGTNGSFAGRFRLQRPVQHGEQSLLRVEAEGYAPGTVFLTDPPGTGKEIVVELERESFLEAIVLSPANTPAAGAEVVMAGRTLGATLAKPFKFFFSGQPTRDHHTKTLSNGTFRLAARAEGERLLIVHSSGWAVVPVAEVGGSIVLQPWGRVEGVLKLGGKPAANQKVVTEAGVSNAFTFGFDAKTDAEGHFAFDKVPPGPVKISRWTMSPLSRDDSGYAAVSHDQRAQVNAGRTTRVDLGGTGIQVKGRLVLQPAREDAVLELFPQKLRLAGEKPGATGSASSYGFFCKSDGSFTVDDVPSGDYIFEVRLWGMKDRNSHEFLDDGFSIAERDLNVTIPDTTQTEFDLGTLNVSAGK